MTTRHKQRVGLALGSLLLGGGLFTLFLVLFGLAVMIKYSFAIIEQRGSGASTPPGVGEVLSSDQDHLFLERTTNFMVHGEYRFITGKASYAFSTDNGEGGPGKGVIPLGWDFRYQSDQKGILYPPGI